MARAGVCASEMPFTSLLWAFRGAGALQAKLAFAPDHERSCARDDGRTKVDQPVRQFAEQPVAQKQRPQHRRIVEGRDDRSRRNSRSERCAQDRREIPAFRPIDLRGHGRAGDSAYVTTIAGNIPANVQNVRVYFPGPEPAAGSDLI